LNRILGILTVLPEPKQEQRSIKKQSTPCVYDPDARRAHVPADCYDRLVILV